MTPDNIARAQQLFHARVRACHESCIGRLKKISILQQSFRCSVRLHRNLSHAVTTATAFMIQYEIQRFGFKVVSRVNPLDHLNFLFDQSREPDYFQNHKVESL